MDNLIIQKQVEDAIPVEQRLARSIGASKIGAECSRQIWYSFRRFSQRENLDPRIARLFSRGAHEESIIIDYLRKGGLVIHELTSDKRQYKFKALHGHFRGKIDGFIESIPDREGFGILEMKTANQAGFKGIKKNGINIEHHAQMQVYMKFFKASWALYIVINKNDDEWHFEIVDYNPELAGGYYALAQSLIISETPPPRITKTPTDYRCRFCDYKEVCHQAKKAFINCRSCIHSKPIKNGTWACRKLIDLITPYEDKDGYNKMICKGKHYEQIRND